MMYEGFLEDVPWDRKSRKKKERVLRKHLGNFVRGQKSEREEKGQVQGLEPQTLRYDETERRCEIPKQFFHHEAGDFNQLSDFTFPLNYLLFNNIKLLN